MDTILYFYGKRDLKEPYVEPVGLKSHMLIRVGLNVGEEEWFGIRPGSNLPRDREPERNAGAEEARPPAQEGNSRRRFWGFPSRHRPEIRQMEARRRFFEEKKGRGGRRPGVWKEDLKGRKKRRRLFQRKGAAVKNSADNPGNAAGTEEEEGKRRTSGRPEISLEIEAAIKKLYSYILELAGEESSCFAVYEDGVRKALLGGKEDRAGDAAEWEGEEALPGAAFPAGRAALPAMWRKYMEFKEFAGYMEAFWVEMLLPHAALHHFVVLGTAPCLFGLMEKCAPGMKSLKWILPESECGREVLEFVEDFYTEYGLAISLQILSDSGACKRLGALCALPSNILDFTGEGCVNVPEASKGSVWLDFGSVEEKRRRILRRCPEVSYFSLKEHWRHAQRRCRNPYSREADIPPQGDVHP